MIAYQLSNFYFLTIAATTTSAQCKDDDASQRNFTVCLNKTKELECGEDKILHILEGTNYGNLGGSTCNDENVGTVTSSTARSNSEGSSPSSNNAADPSGTNNGVTPSGTNNGGGTTITNNAADNRETTTATRESSNSTQCKEENVTEKVKEMFV